jgi:hypothetical protein
MISEEIQKWNKGVWILNLIERKLEKKFKEELISKKEYKRNKEIINLAWIRIWDFHPEQHPYAKELFKKHFGEIKELEGKE